MPNSRKVKRMSNEESARTSDASTRETRRRRRQRGLVIVNTGDGKGKTTAALGVLFRAWGRDYRVRMFQFIKSSTSNYGEHKAAKRLGIRIEAMGDGFTWLSKDLERTAALAVEQWERCREVLRTGTEDIVVLDEFTYAMSYGWVPVADVVQALAQRPPAMHVIVTGRNAPQELIDCADLVTEMREVKHPYTDQGIKAQPGIEF